jgi:hypothetical protein
VQGVVAIALLQTVVCGLACFGLWKLFTKIQSFGPVASSIVIAGFLIRAAGGVILFWISYLSLPIAPRFQLGEGFWFFALDGKSYFRIASEAAQAGPATIIFLEDSLPSPFYLQVLASFILFLGSIPSVGLFLNLLAYVGLSLIILLWARRTGRIGPAGLIALAGAAFTPGLILWSLQPLKDTLFVFLTVLFVGASFYWKELLRSPASPRSWPFLRLVAAVLVMSVALYGIAGMRWYFAAIVLTASLVFLLLSVIPSPRRWLVLVLNLVLFVLLTRMVVYGAGPYLPPYVQAALAPATALESIPVLPRWLVFQINEARRGFDRTAGNTLILPGSRPRPADTTAAAQPPPLPRGFVPARSRSQPTAKKATRPQLPSASQISQPPASLPTPQPVKPMVISEDSSAAPGTVNQPGDVLSRFVTGSAAVLLPRAVAQKLGIIRVGGGKGLWPVVELDTIIFDVVLIIALVFLMKWIRYGSLADPMVWMVVLMTVLLAVPLVYTVSNFGTLFRLRAMILLGLLLVPPAVTASIRAVTRARLREETIAPVSGSKTVEPVQAS